MADTNITDDHRRAFDALSSGEAGNFCLFSCFLAGEPAAALTVCPPAEDGGEPEYPITPVFVSVTSNMKLVDHDGREA